MDPKYVSYCHTCGEGHRTSDFQEADAFFLGHAALDHDVNAIDYRLDQGVQPSTSDSTKGSA